MTTPPSSRRPLNGRGIVVTRPAEQADTLARLVEREGGRAIVFPVIAIEDVSDRARLEHTIDRLDDFDIAIFISPNAAARGMAAVRARRQWPPRLIAAAIGAGTARELKRHGIERVIVPEQRFDSEGLLDLAPLRAVAGKHIVIFRGEGGRPVLGETLVGRGARVTYAECYRRTKPNTDRAPLMDAWSRDEVHAVVATSSEGLRNFHEMLDETGRAHLKRTPLFVPHPRIAASAHALGIDSVIVTAAGDEAIAAGIASHFA